MDKLREEASLRNGYLFEYQELLKIAKSMNMQVILRQCEIINSLKNEIQAQVCFPEAPEFNPDWLDHNAEIKKNLTFNISTDLIVLPEVWALSYASKFLEAGIKYVIFVQNGYYILMRPSEATGSLSSYLTRLIKAPAASLPLA